MHIKLLKRVFDIGRKKIHVNLFINPGVIALGFRFMSWKDVLNGPKYELDLHLWPVHLYVHCWWNFTHYHNADGSLREVKT